MAREALRRRPPTGSAIRSRMIIVNTVLIFANPIAGQGRGKRIAESLRKILYATGFDVRVFLDRPDDITRDAMGGPDEQLAAAISIGLAATSFSVGAAFASSRATSSPRLRSLAGNS